MFMPYIPLLNVSCRNRSYLCRSVRDEWSNRRRNVTSRRYWDQVYVFRGIPAERGGFVNLCSWRQRHAMAATDSKLYPRYPYSYQMWVRTMVFCDTWICTQAEKRLLKTIWFDLNNIKYLWVISWSPVFYSFSACQFYCLKFTQPQIIFCFEHCFKRLHF